LNQTHVQNHKLKFSPLHKIWHLCTIQQQQQQLQNIEHQLLSCCVIKFFIKTKPTLDNLYIQVHTYSFFPNPAEEKNKQKTSPKKPQGAK
jgi:hypothetical protein